MSNHYSNLIEGSRLRVEQVWEGFEIVLGWETRNKYRILNAQGMLVGFAAEQSSGFLGTIARGILGHWRSFNIFIFNEHKQQVLDLHFPFRWFFKTLFIKSHEGQILGTLQQRFSIFYKKFDVLDPYGKSLAIIKSPLFKFWTFEFLRGDRKIGVIKKKWSGTLGEFFTDKDNFEIFFEDPTLNSEMKILMLSTCLMVDIVYFENNKGGNALDLFGN